MASDPVLVLGAGIQGVTAALALTQAGFAVTVVDQAPACLLRASLVNEGKIHLGHVYANDPTFQTSALMLEAALQFAPLIERFVGHAVDWSGIRSHPFTYVVAAGSLVEPAQILAHYERLNRQLEATTAVARRNYLGQPIETLWRPAPIPPWLGAGFATAAVTTPEAAVDTAAFRELLRCALERAPVGTLFSHTVRSARRAAGGFEVEGVTADGATWRRRCRVLVNCLWSGRLAIDQQLGVLALRPRAYRLKHRLYVDLPPALADLPALTIVLGPFGDIVTYPDRRTAYLSWYPACMRDWCSDVNVPERWNAAASGCFDAGTAAAVVAGSLDAFETIVPGIRESTNPRLAAGVIVSWGQSDIDDPGSQLHRRYDIGVHPHDGYFSIDTGKFTCAPLFADRLVAHVREALA